MATIAGSLYGVDSYSIAELRPKPHFTVSEIVIDKIFVFRLSRGTWFDFLSHNLFLPFVFNSLFFHAIYVIKMLIVGALGL